MRRPGPALGEAFDRLLAESTVSPDTSPGRESRKPPVEPASGGSNQAAESASDLTARRVSRSSSDTDVGAGVRESASEETTDTPESVETSGVKAPEDEEETLASASPALLEEEAIEAIGEAADSAIDGSQAAAPEPTPDLPQPTPTAAPVAAPPVQPLTATGDPTITDPALHAAAQGPVPAPLRVPADTDGPIPPTQTDAAPASASSPAKGAAAETAEVVAPAPDDGRAAEDAPAPHRFDGPEIESDAPSKPAASHGEQRHETHLSIHAPRGSTPATVQALAPPGPFDPSVAALAPGLSPFAQSALLRPMAATDQPSSVPLSGIAIEIATRARDGQRQFEIRLDPPELGRIDVRLHLDKEGGITSRLIVERPETLDLLRRDAANLERALQSSGLKTDGGVEFSLRDQSQNGRHPPFERPPAAEGARVVLHEDILPANDPGLSKYTRLLGLGVGVDIRI